MICKMLLKVNYFAGGKSKGLVSRFFIKAEVTVFCVNAVFHTIYFQMFFCIVLSSNSFSVKVFKANLMLFSNIKR